MGGRVSGLRRAVSVSAAQVGYICLIDEIVLLVNCVILVSLVSLVNLVD
jgi:hypothetical protein